MHSFRSKYRSGRTAFSLIEIVAAMILTGILAAVSTHRLQTSAARVLETAVTAQTLSLELDRMRHLAIRNGEPHGIQFDRTSNKVTSLTFYRRTIAGAVAKVGIPKPVAASAEIAVDGSTIEFNVEGSTSFGTTLTVSADNRKWLISVAPLTGICSVTEL